MITKFTLVALALGAGVATAMEPGKPAPDFTLKDTRGAEHALSGFRGKYVVLEWTNPNCPFVRSQYNSGNMQALQKEFTGKDVVWLTIASSAPGKEGHYTAEQWNERMKKENFASTAVLLDPKGTAGRAFDARVTPHMFVIDPKGTVIYAGAIDDKPSTHPADAKAAKNLVRAALEEAMAGRPVSTPSSRPYGCSVKY